MRSSVATGHEPVDQGDHRPSYGWAAGFDPLGRYDVAVTCCDPQGTYLDPVTCACDGSEQTSNNGVWRNGSVAALEAGGGGSIPLTPTREDAGFECPPGASPSVAQEGERPLILGHEEDGNLPASDAGDTWFDSTMPDQCCTARLAKGTDCKSVAKACWVRFPGAAPRE